MHIRYVELMKNIFEKAKEHGFPVIYDLRVDVFMAYERALYILKAWHCY